jgi:hypothetical protein
MMLQPVTVTASNVEVFLFKIFDPRISRLTVLWRRHASVSIQLPAFIFVFVFVLV